MDTDASRSLPARQIGFLFTVKVVKVHEEMLSLNKTCTDFAQEERKAGAQAQGLPSSQAAVLPPCRVPRGGSPASVSALPNTFTTQSLPWTRRTAWNCNLEVLFGLDINRMEEACSYSSAA